MRYIALLLIVSFVLPVQAADPQPNWPRLCIMDLSPATRKMYYNPDGSCVQCAQGLNGAWLCDFNRATLLWDTSYGPAVRGGSSPSRVANYCRQRGIAIYNVTGNSFEDTKEWMEYGIGTGRGAAIGFFSRHFQMLYGRDFDRDLWYVQNNWPGTFDQANVYSPAEFKRLHEASGAWVVVPKCPQPAPDPFYVKWWNE